jgi:hypothetical protein
MKDRGAAAARAKELIAALGAADQPARETAQRELERLAPQVVGELRAALVIATGDKAERLFALLQRAGDAAPPASDALVLARLREVLSMSPEPAARDAVKLLGQSE